MLTGVEVTNSQGATLALSLFDVSNGYSIEDIQGLDPVKANLVSSSFAQLDGEQYQTARREKRNLVFKLGLEPDFVTSTARSLRTGLYGYFMPKSEVKMKFLHDVEADVEIVGRVESFDSPPFSQEPDATISVVCFKPDFIDPTPMQVTGNSVADLSEKLVNYSGTIETGFLFRLLVNQSIPDFSVVNRTPDGNIRSMDFAAPLVAGDVVEISTIPGAKRVTLIRDDSSSSILYGFSPYSDWLQLFPGQNFLRVSIQEGVIPYTIDYTTKYGGL